MNKARKIVHLFIGAFCSLIFIYLMKSTNVQQAHGKDGFGIDKGNILFDGRGEFDYLRGEPSAVQINNQYRNAVDNDHRTPVIVDRSEVNIISDSFEYHYTTNNVQKDSKVNYIHCNTRDSFSAKFKAKAFVQDANTPIESSSILPLTPGEFTSGRLIRGEEESVYEILLLHDSRHSIHDWSSSGILHEFCINGIREVIQKETKERQVYLSATAIDLDPNASGFELYHALRSLERIGIVSGEPMIIITPFESSKTVVSLGTYASVLTPNIEADEGEVRGGDGTTTIVPQDSNVMTQPQSNRNLNKHNGRRLEREPDHVGALLLTHLVKTWIAISAIDVLESSAEALRAFLLANINVLSIHDNDASQKRASDRLVGAAGAQSARLDGDYMSNQEILMEIISKFLF